MNFDAVVIGSGFGGAICAARLAEAGMKVLVLERGRWWDKVNSIAPERTAYPREPGDPWLWDQDKPEKCNGWIDLRPFRNMTVVQGAAVGGGSLVYANISCEAPPETFENGWPAEISYAELKPYYDTVKKVMNVQPLPPAQWTKRTELMKRSAELIGDGARFRPLELAVSFDPAWNYELDDSFSVARHSHRFVNEQGVEQGTCVHLGNCDIGCEADAKNTLDRNYLPLGLKCGLQVRPLHLVTSIEPQEDGYCVRFDDLRNGKRTAGSVTSTIVVIAAGSLGSTELLLRCKQVWKTLPAISDFLGKDWSSNGDFLTPAFHPFEVLPTRGPTISSAINYLDGSDEGERYWIEDGGFPDILANAAKAEGGWYGEHAGVRVWLEALQRALRNDPLKGVMPWFAQGVDAANGQFHLRRKYWLFGKHVLKLQWEIEKSRQVINAIVERHKKLAQATGGVPIVPPTWTVAGDLITPHPLGGCNFGSTREDGVANHAGEVFGYPGLYVCDGALIPEAVGVNPSRTIGAVAERIARLMVERWGHA